MLKRIVYLLILSVLLSGCAAQDFETVMDTQPILETQPAAGIRIQLPEDASLAVLGDESVGKIYLCEGYEISVQTLTGGDLERTLREITGFTKDRLTLLKTVQDATHRYDCVWSSAGETEQRVGKLAILDDGTFHYVVSVMADESVAESLQDRFDDLFRSFSLVSTEQ